MSRLQAAFDAFDNANREDPNSEWVDGLAYPKELLYGQRMSAQLDAFCPDASEPLQLAARCQHIRRWEIPRSDYPMDRTGYKRWRSQLAVYHGEVAAGILAPLGYDTDTIERVRYLLQKRGLKRDAEVQTLEDVICLVFLEYYLVDFAHKHAEAKLLDIIRKTWQKMSVEGQTAALKLPLSTELQTLIGKALTP